MNRVRVAGDQRMPPVQIAPFGNELVAAAWRQPVQGPDILRRQSHAVRHFVRSVRVILTGTQSCIEKRAGDVGEVDLARVLVLELLQTAPPAAIAQAFPLAVGHFLQRLGFPERSALG